MQPKSETVLQVNNKIIFLCLAAAQKEYYDKKRNRRTQPGNGELNCSLLYLDTTDIFLLECSKASNQTTSWTRTDTGMADANYEVLNY